MKILLLNTLYTISGILIVWIIPIIIFTYKYKEYIKQIPTRFKKWLSTLNIYVYLHNLLIIGFISLETVIGLSGLWVIIFILSQTLMSKLNTFFVIGIISGAVILIFTMMIVTMIWFVNQDFYGFKNSKLTFMKNFYKHYYEQIEKQQ